VYSFLIPIKGTITVFDTIVFLTLYGFYLWTASKTPSRESHLVGPAAVIAELPRPPRLALTWGFFIIAAGVIYLSSEPFAQSLIHGGKTLGIDEFLLVQWLAPFASESPEFLAVILLTLKGSATDGMGALVSSKVNQWSLLVGMVPLVFAFGHLHTFGIWQGGFHLDPRQTEELVLTSAQSLYALSAIFSYRFRLLDAWWLMGLFFFQMIGTILLEESGGHRFVTTWHYSISLLYIILAVIRTTQCRVFFPAILRGTFHMDEATYEAVMTGYHGADAFTSTSVMLDDDSVAGDHTHPASVPVAAAAVESAPVPTPGPSPTPTPPVPPA
ncbi:MAG: hypothetical protein ABI743_03590, partial [bacterium]